MSALVRGCPRTSAGDARELEVPGFTVDPGWHSRCSTSRRQRRRTDRNKNPRWKHSTRRLASLYPPHGGRPPRSDRPSMGGDAAPALGPAVRQEPQGASRRARPWRSSAPPPCDDRPSRMTVQVSEHDAHRARPAVPLVHQPRLRAERALRRGARAARRAPADRARATSSTFFYPSTEWAMASPFDCHCGSARCLGRIAGASQVPAARSAAARSRRTSCGSSARPAGRSPRREPRRDEEARPVVARRRAHGRAARPRARRRPARGRSRGEHGTPALRLRRADAAAPRRRSSAPRSPRRARRSASTTR